MLSRLAVKFRVWRGKAIDIGIRNDYPANVLSNESNNAFMLDGYYCASMESFMRSLCRHDSKEQRKVCRMRGEEAKAMNPDGTYAQTLYWNGRSFPRCGTESKNLLRRAYHALFVQNDTFQTALLATKGKQLFCTENRKRYDIACERLFTSILTDLRENSHNIILENMRMVNNSIRLTSDQLVKMGIDTLKPVVEGAHMTEQKVLTVPADKELFPRGFAFHLIITPPTPGNSQCQNHCKLGLMEVKVSDSIYSYTRPIGFGTPSFLIGRLADRKVRQKITGILLDGYDFLSTDTIA